MDCGDGRRKASEERQVKKGKCPAGWHGRTAGAPALIDGRPNSTWCCNPQFILTSRRPGELLLSVSQQDPMVANGGHVPKCKRTVQFGFQVVELAAGHRDRLWTLAGQNVLHDSGLQAARELTLSVQLSGGSGLLVVPYCSAPGSEGPFVLRTFSSVAIEMTQASCLLPILAAAGHYALAPCMQGLQKSIHIQPMDTFCKRSIERLCR
jgi:hypothetical protein